MKMGLKGTTTLAQASTISKQKLLGILCCWSLELVSGAGLLSCWYLQSFSCAVNLLSCWSLELVS